jgi:hypothetical protein
VLFMKNPASVIGPGEAIELSPVVQTDDRDPPMGVDYEGELAVILGRDARDVPMDQAQEVIAAVACANGVSQRWWQWHSSGGQWCRGKSFDTFCPLGEVVPQASTATMIFPVARLISELSQGTTLLAGVVLAASRPVSCGMAIRWRWRSAAWAGSATPCGRADRAEPGCVAWVQSNPKRSKISRSLRDSASRGFTLSSID